MKLTPNADDLTCDMISDIARSLAPKSFKEAHEKLENCISSNKIDGMIFMNEYHKVSNARLDDDDDVQVHQDFMQFFNVKICDQKDNSEKYTKFREWLITEIKGMKDDDDTIITNKNRIDFIKFILDGFDEFIANLFVEKEINGRIFMDKGVRTIVNEISDEYGITRGGLENLCHAMEEDIKSNSTESINTENTGSWITRPSTQILSVSIR